ncbi:hypothetical protein JCM11251_002796 [Rhodosporidiobolus azoricus]
MCTSFALLATIALAAADSVSADRTFTVKNNAIFTSAGTAPSFPRGWEAKAGSSVSFGVAENWNGRIWPRTGCAFTGSGLPDECTTGGCNGGLECATVGGTGKPPATLIELNLDAPEDWLDISLVDGSNVAASLSNNAGCPEPSCPGAAVINEKCPAELSVHDADGTVVGCMTACAANLDGNAANSPACCSGDYATPDKCPAAGIPHYDLFKKNCPTSYAYAYDESSQSALYTCPKDKKADYTITFCP